MTSRNQPHKYRCETCTYFIGKMENAFGVDQPFCSNPKIVEYNKQKPETCGQISPTRWSIEDHYIMKKDLYFSPMSNFDVERISILGCASHSSATKAEQRITDVIKELEKERIKLEKYPVTTTTSGVLVGMGKALVLLRGKEE